jgi:hypothetical protein
MEIRAISPTKGPAAMPFQPRPDSRQRILAVDYNPAAAALVAAFVGPPKNTRPAKISKVCSR